VDDSSEVLALPGPGMPAERVERMQQRMARQRESTNVAAH
jgi:hypothetical protein